MKLALSLILLAPCVFYIVFLVLVFKNWGNGLCETRVTNGEMVGGKIVQQESIRYVKCAE